MEYQEKMYDIMLAKLQSGEVICVTAPYAKGEESGAVVTTAGEIGKIVSRVPDYTGEIVAMLDQITHVRKARRVMRTVWDVKEDGDA